MLGARMRLFATKCKVFLTNFIYNKSPLRWMSKEPAEIFERAADDGFVAQVRIPTEQMRYVTDGW